MFFLKNSIRITEPFLKLSFSNELAECVENSMRKTNMHAKNAAKCCVEELDRVFSFVLSG